MWQDSQHPQINVKIDSISNMLDHIFLNAIEKKASDIHFEPTSDAVQVRLRIDGLLQQFQTFPKEQQSALLSRIKVMSQLDIAEQRLPQDGHLAFHVQDVTYHFRVSTFPTSNGETIVLRMMNREDSILSLPQLGFNSQQLLDINDLIRNPYGIILSTGPTGSGKTTLLYSILHEINNPQRNVLTLEDPIEMQISNTQQLQINEGIDLTFARALRAVVRQDPDIIMLGEIRDADTAQMAMQAALIGILILSTFHTFDIPALVTRFSEMGISHSIIAQAVKGVISTQLVRKVCTICAQPYKPTQKEIDICHLSPSDFSKMCKGKGCPTCHNTGYNGRIGIFEVVVFDKQIQECIIASKMNEMYELISNKHIASLKDSAVQKIKDGLTTFDELQRVLGVIPS